MDGCADSERAGSRGWAQSNEETMANRWVLAPPPNGHRRLAGDVKSAAVDMGIWHRRRWRRFLEPGLDSFDGRVEDGVAELRGISTEHGEASSAGKSAATVAVTRLGLGFRRGRERETAGREMG